MTDTYMNHYDDTDGLNYNHIAMLLKVIEMAIPHGPAFTNIIAVANAELLECNAGALKIMAKRAEEVKAKAEAEAAAAAPVTAPSASLAAAPEPTVPTEPTGAGDQTPEDHPPAAPVDGTAVERRL